MKTPQPVYFAGGMYGPECNEKFHFVHSSAEGPNGLPYLTHDPHGLQMTAHHASLYELAPDLKSAKLVDIRSDLDGVNPVQVCLTPDQMDLFRYAIAEDYFFD